MPFQTTCPECHKSLRVADETRGKKIRCPSCQTVFPAGAVAEDVPSVLPADRPRAATPDAIARTRSKPAPRLADDNDDRPAPAKKSNSILPYVLAGCGALVLLCGGGASIVGFLMYRAAGTGAEAVQDRWQEEINQVEEANRIAQQRQKEAEDINRAAREQQQRDRQRIEEQIKAAQERQRRLVEERNKRRKGFPLPDPPMPRPPQAPVEEVEPIVPPGPPAPPAPAPGDVVQPVVLSIPLECPADRIAFLLWPGPGVNRVVVGQRLLTGKLRLDQYDIGAKRKVAGVEQPGNFTDFVPPHALSADGKLFLSAAQNGSFSVWSVEDGKALVQGWRLPQKLVYAAHLLPGRRLLTVHDMGRVILWSLPAAAGQEPKQEASYLPPADVARYPRGRGPAPTALAPDGSRLAVFNGSDGFFLLNTATLQLQGMVNSPEDGRKDTDNFNGVVGAAFSPDGKQLAALFWGERPVARRPRNLPPPSRPNLVRWDVQTRQRLARFADPSVDPAKDEIFASGIAWWGAEHCWVSHRNRSDSVLVSWDRPRPVMQIAVDREHLGSPEFGAPDGRCWVLLNGTDGKGLLQAVDLPPAVNKAEQPLKLTYHGITRK